MIEKKRLFPRYFNKQWCDRIVEVADTLPEDEAKIGYRKDGKVDTNIRNSKIKWINFDNKIYKHVQSDLLHLVNHVNIDWAFDIFQSVGSMQFTVYPEGGMYYQHNDTFPEYNNTNRKISISVILSSDEEYEGGEFTLGTTKVKNFIGQGSVLIFPSYMQHSVQPVVRGTRKSLVVWIPGPAWR